MVAVIKQRAEGTYTIIDDEAAPVAD